MHTEQLSYRYPLTAEEVLTDLTLSFPAGKSTVLAGASGIGKSTLLLLLAGQIAPTEGKIVLADGAGSANVFDLTQLSEATKQNLITYVPQEPHIFTATLAENACGVKTPRTKPLSRRSKQRHSETSCAPCPRDFGHRSDRADIPFLPDSVTVSGLHVHSSRTAPLSSSTR